MRETFSSPAERHKAEREVEAFHSFRDLSRQLLEINEKICRVRPLEEFLTTRKKRMTNAIRQEATRELDQRLHVIFNGQRKTGRVDLEAIETTVRLAMQQAGGAVLNELLQWEPPIAGKRRLPCSR